MGAQFPMVDLPKNENDFPNLKQSVQHLPKDKNQLVQALEEELSMTSECLSAYIDFKRTSLSLIFD